MLNNHLNKLKHFSISDPLLYRLNPYLSTRTQIVKIHYYYLLLIISLYKLYIIYINCNSFAYLTIVNIPKLFYWDAYCINFFLVITLNKSDRLQLITVFHLQWILNWTECHSPLQNRRTPDFTLFVPIHHVCVLRVKRGRMCRYIISLRTHDFFDPIRIACVGRCSLLYLHSLFHSLSFLVI